MSINELSGFQKVTVLGHIGHKGSKYFALRCVEVSKRWSKVQNNVDQASEFMNIIIEILNHTYHTVYLL